MRNIPVTASQMSPECPADCLSARHGVIQAAPVRRFKGPQDHQHVHFWVNAEVG
jgi:hypothetical protein